MRRFSEREQVQFALLWAGVLVLCYVLVLAPFLEAERSAARARAETARAVQTQLEIYQRAALAHPDREEELRLRQERLFYNLYYKVLLLHHSHSAACRHCRSIMSKGVFYARLSMRHVRRAFTLQRSRRGRQPSRMDCTYSRLKSLFTVDIFKYFPFCVHWRKGNGRCSLATSHCAQRGGNCTAFSLCASLLLAVTAKRRKRVVICFSYHCPFSLSLDAFCQVMDAL